MKREHALAITSIYFNLMFIKIYRVIYAVSPFQDTQHHIIFHYDKKSIHRKNGKSFYQVFYFASHQFMSFHDMYAGRSRSAPRVTDAPPPAMFLFVDRETSRPPRRFLAELQSDDYISTPPRGTHIAPLAAIC